MAKINKYMAKKEDAKNLIKYIEGKQKEEPNIDRSGALEYAKAEKEAYDALINKEYALKGANSSKEKREIKKQFKENFGKKENKSLKDEIASDIINKNKHKENFQKAMAVGAATLFATGAGLGINNMFKNDPQNPPVVPPVNPTPVVDVVEEEKEFSTTIDGNTYSGKYVEKENKTQLNFAKEDGYLTKSENMDSADSAELIKDSNNNVIPGFPYINSGKFAVVDKNGKVVNVTFADSAQEAVKNLKGDNYKICAFMIPVECYEDYQKATKNGTVDPMARDEKGNFYGAEFGIKGGGWMFVSDIIKDNKKDDKGIIKGDIVEYKEVKLNGKTVYESKDLGNINDNIMQ